MGITPKFGNGAVARQIEAFKQRLDKATLYMLNYLGESLASYAKDRHNYTDRTGNLTNSIGYAVVRNRKIVTYGGAIQPGEGASEGLKIATEMANNCQGTFSLLIVAGMNYAAYVEAQGYNVILPAELKAKADFPAAMQRLSAMAKSKAQQIFNANI